MTAARPTPGLRSLALVPILLLLAVATLAVVDRSSPVARLELDGRLDQPFLTGFSPPEVRGDRVAYAGATVRIPGLGAEAPLRARFYVASGVRGGQVVDLELNGRLVLRRDVASGGVLEAEGFADEEGTALFRISGPPPERGAQLLVGRVEIEGRSPWRVPRRRLAAYGALAGLALAWCAWAWPASRGRWVPWLLTLGGVVLVAALAILHSRVLFLGRLPSLLAIGAGALLLAVLARRLGLRTGFAATVALTAAFRLVCTREPAFPAIDETFHAHRIVLVQRGQLVTSAVAGARPGTYMEIPYPPGFHVLLAPLVPRNDPRAGERAVRLAMAFFEGTAPLLLFLIARRGGASELAAGLAAVCAAAMPEALLVVGKGIAANVAGSWFTLLAVLAVLSGASPAVVALTMALGFLVHPGAAATLGGLAGVWLLARYRRERSAALRNSLLALAAGALLAFLVYFREVLPMTLRSLEEVRRGSAEVGKGLLRVEWVHLGKVIQNLMLKFGGGPLWLAWIGLGVAAEPLRTLLRAWLGVGVALALLAVFGPIALRFEYFAAPAVALAAGLGAADLWQRERRPLVQGILAAAVALQVLLGLLLLQGHFVLRNVIIPSENWPMVESLWPRSR